MTNPPARQRFKLDQDQLTELVKIPEDTCSS